MNTHFAKCFLHLQRAEFALGLGARMERRVEWVGGDAEPSRGFGLEIQGNVSLLPDLGGASALGFAPRLWAGWLLRASVSPSVHGTEQPREAFAMKLRGRKGQF